MPINRRLSRAQQPPTDHKGNHWMLKLGSTHLMIWQYVKGRPGSTREDIRFACTLHPNAVNARVNEMINEGLLRETGERRIGRAGRSGKCLEVMPGGDVGRGRDALGIEIRVFANNLGQYSIEATLLGEMASSRDHEPTLVYTKEVIVRVPREREGKTPLGSQPEAVDPAPLIDGEYREIEEQ